ncbi:MAG: hypothetical protein EOP45_13305, partial [Sphingobacteriaceae bacterium]
MKPIPAEILKFTPVISKAKIPPIMANGTLFNKMPDIIDFNCGTVIEGQETTEQSAHRLLNYVIDVANGDI